MEPSIATPPVMPVPSGDDKPKSSMLVKVSLILLIVVLVAALGYIAYAKFISPPTKIAPVLEEQVTEETPSQYVPAEETVPAEGEQPVEEMIVTEEVTTQTEVTTTEPTPEPTP
jgi:flagellar basal body-associated protein FliL